MNKIKKIFNIIYWIACIIGLLMIIWFIIMVIMLARYDDCRDMNFQSSYCEKYKDF